MDLAPSSRSSPTAHINMPDFDPSTSRTSKTSLSVDTALCCSSVTEMNGILTALVRAPRTSSVVYKRAPARMSLSKLREQVHSRAHEANKNPCCCEQEDGEGKKWYIPIDRECGCETPCGRPCLLQAMHHSCASYNTALGSRVSAGASLRVWYI
jgi:hypothetical protein